ncbi:hypothetical protein [Psychroflexus maritimus]|uniref:Outer membrane protein beta-barrel family protein n=1 Tax=Psychroflexus maritimus TaxID=2714865 RepID=A0A967DYD0_9FLAO|nr:hypothetical protein [Psychroflexus maritimus]NGZ89690.1 hypothetical protein [Psychroflexus maritimus]
MKSIFCCLFLLIASGFAHAQEDLMLTKTIATQDSIFLEDVSISSADFKLQTLQNQTVDTSSFTINYGKALLVMNQKIQQENDSLQVTYRNFPGFLTKTYQALDEAIIVDETSGNTPLYEVKRQDQSQDFVPFDGLNTSGSISRGVRVGNNQNAVVDSELDLQISGKLSEDVTLRASIQDANTPLQQGGYSQRLNEFDQVFIELQGKNWGIRAGDIDLVEDKYFFASYNKKIQGLLVSTQLQQDTNPIEAYAAGALVRGVWTRSELVGQEGNQGPYKLTGPNGELLVLIISGSESVFVNGRRLKRGENEDYLIDYNAGEIIFNANFPITSEMRIVIEYQYADQNYSRVLGTAGGSYQTEKFQISSFVYTETDLRNQPIQQALSDEQVGVLREAGNDQSQMIAPSAVPTDFSENRILYRKEILNGEEIFVFSNDPEDELFSVRFTNVGANQGNYVVSTDNAISRIFEYVPPQNGVPQGEFEPVIQLFAPERLQVGVVQSTYKNGEHSYVSSELAVSDQDKNLFSNLDNDDNQGLAYKVETRQRVVNNQNNWNVDVFGNLDYIHRNYTSIERLYNVEFQRDWNLFNPDGNQRLIDLGTNVNHLEKGNLQYQFQHLDFSESFTGNRQVFNANFNFEKLTLVANASYLKTDGSVLDSEFSRANFFSVYDLGKPWVGAKFNYEDNEELNLAENQLTINTQRFKSYEVFTGVGDSTDVFVEVGYRFRENDSLRSNQLERVNRSNNIYLKSTTINTQSTRLDVFASYRNLQNSDPNLEDENVINSRITFSQTLLDRMLSLNTAYETNSGSIAQQEFTYVEVNPGEGQYVWIDYNENGVQELDEFELAQFPAEADFIRILLPNQIFIRTNQTRFSQQMNLNFKAWSNEEGFKKLLSKFSNQVSFVVDRKLRRDGNLINLNPFSANGQEELGRNTNIRNALFFNRGKQRYTTSYNFIQTQSRNLSTIGLQDNNTQAHQLNFVHKLYDTWLLTFQNELTNSESISENFENRNFQLDGFSINPKISYLLGNNARFDAFAEFGKKENQIAEQELLEQQILGASFTLNQGQKYAITGEFNYIKNDFSGSAFTPVAYQMMEGLQPDNNFTWSVFLQKKITDFLDLNLTYFGRKSENTSTVHTGNVQLRAYF